MTRLEKADKIVKLLEDINYLSNCMEYPKICSKETKKHCDMVNENRRAIIFWHNKRIKKLKKEI